jgi:hypothetical protein
MGPPSYMWSVVDQNEVMQPMTVSSVDYITQETATPQKYTLY